ncbi:CRISPR-associated helicase Cas3' [Streptomyces sp. PU-14G]|uniref:CRISPR-associated helicase Cas3' n=1 Tax=Streptomyces sp. PU-14G TaxID=2800808 RepID=UPI0034DE899D
MMRKLVEGPDETAWGKSRGLLVPYPLVRHLLDAAAVASYLWDAYLSENQRRHIAIAFGSARDMEHARALTALCAGLHDIGKLSGFAFCDARGRAGLSDELLGDKGQIGAEARPHDVVGMESIPAVLQALGFEDEEVVEWLAQIVGGHHGQFHRFDENRAYNTAYRARLGGPAWARQRVAHGSAVFDFLGRPQAPELEGESAPSACVLVTGVVILADWLVSQEHYLKRRQQQLDPDLGRHFAQSCRDAEGLVREAGLVPVELGRKEFAEAYAIDGAPNPLQRSVQEELGAAVAARRTGEGVPGKAGITLVTAAPGDGKTEAALEAERVLSAAFGTRGFAFLLPTMSTSDQMHGRVAKMLHQQEGEGSALTLVHSMAWLDAAYADDELESAVRVLGCEEEKAGGERSAAERRRSLPELVATRPVRWLRGSKRPLLAQYAVGTIDQALMAVLPVRHNVLRLLALSGKTFIVDEAHAYDPYMQVLLGRLLNWLGAYGVPVVLLSATLPASVSDKLIKEYLRGAGTVESKLDKTYRAPYPGWLYADAASGDSVTISCERQQEQAAQRPVELQIQVEPVARKSEGGEDPRLAAIERLLRPMEAGGGCVLVVCNTVAEAQETYLSLRGRFAGQEDVQLLHARFPGDVREELTRKVTDGMGREGPRPERKIVVATQVVEQSLDLDADLVISDLAPLALLLQRAGRCWRHESWWARHGRPEGGGRPAWAEGPRLVVLDPVADGGQVPKRWGEVYPEFLLTETSALLHEYDRRTMSIPGEVQELVERVHGDQADRFDWNTPQDSYLAYLGDTCAKESLGKSIVIPRVGNVESLHELHREAGTEEEWQAATRLGAESVRLLCTYQQPGGSLTLDVEGNVPLPRPDDEGRFAADDVRAVMRKTIPVRADWFQAEKVDQEAHRPDETWREHPMLGDLVLLRHPVRDGAVDAVQVGAKAMLLDETLGLTRL